LCIRVVIIPGKKGVKKGPSHDDGKDAPRP